MTVTLHRCRLQRVKAGACWRVERALREMAVDYDLAAGSYRPSKRGAMVEHTGQPLYPAIEFEDGSWYREESLDTAATIRAGRLLERAATATPAASG